MREYIRRGLNRILGSDQATIDTIEPGRIVVTPRKPIDLHDEAAITEVLDLAARIGAVLLDSGTGAIDTRDQVAFVAGIYGLDDVDVDVTFNTVLICARRGSTLPPITASRTVAYRSLDFTRLAETDRLVRRIRSLAISPASAHRIVDVIIAAPHPYARWISTLAWGVMAYGVAVFLAAGWLIGLTAFLSSVSIVVINRYLNRIGTPPFFQQMTGGFVAVLPAAVLFRILEFTSYDINPAKIIAAGIVVLLSGLSLVGAVQDAITGAPITGTARFTEVLVMTGGILVGVALAVRFVGLFGIELPELTTIAPFGASDLPARIIGGAIVSGGFAAASYAERRALPAAIVSGALGSGVQGVMAVYSTSPLIGYAAAAVVVGLIGGVAARRALTPPLVIAIAGITPMLPGLAIYRGMYGLLNNDPGRGGAEMATAFALGCALAAGVTLGEFIARRLRRPHLSPAIPDALRHVRPPVPPLTPRRIRDRARRRRPPPRGPA
ncbi:threonine/serine ThrE exporter family protein [Gordonia sp. (in: high G+C Gram-positive bacteria)]|uniref:threonine/serine ThrE exporter family protein n=1 Tax=unclassified Gordonia (in: high G+C Gram-positive bacteria) TaxID=2657482 RepID=UPI00261AA97E|nr:threonine/serine exporter family protein [Gordonia sp. (in: high G+C Gram-positive bacteria)]